MKISLILPARNEEDNLKIIVPKILNQYNKDIFEIIIVNDGSVDHTKEVSEGLSKKYKKVKVINRKILDS